MSSETLFIRNLTAFSISLTQVERCLAPLAPLGGYSWTSWVSSFTASSPPQATETSTVVEKKDSTATKDVNLVVPPLQTSPVAAIGLTFHLPNAQSVSKSTLKLTFSISHQSYELTFQAAEDESTNLTPLATHPSHEFTAIYLTSESWLTILPSTNLQAWMSNLSPTTRLSDLSLPGTHNSPTHHRALPSVRCQAVSIRRQLDNGVRFLDIRLQPSSASDLNNETLYLVHGAFSVKLTGYLTFRGLLERVYTFLDTSPSETILISLKREGIGKATDTHLARLLARHYIAAEPARWYAEPRIPSLGEVRGKLVLLRRFHYDPSLTGDLPGVKAGTAGWGIDAISWADNTAHFLSSTGQLCIQDFYEVLESVNIGQKVEYIKTHLARATAENKHTRDRGNIAAAPLYINFLSASNFWRSDCWPERIARAVNPAILRYLCCEHGTVDKKGSSTGVVVCDWVGNAANWDLVRTIIAMNGPLLAKHVDAQA